MTDQYGTDYAYQPVEPEKKKPNVLLIVLIVLAVLCICCVVGSLLMYFVLGDLIIDAMGISLLAPGLSSLI